MLVAPRAASASPSKTEGSGRHGWVKRQRLLRSPEFDAPAGPQGSWRASRRWLALSAAVFMDTKDSPGTSVSPSKIRFGLVVARRQAPRAVARNMVKRILREAARHAAPRLESVAGVNRADVVLRLKSALPDARQSTWHEVKAAIRRDADALLEQLGAQLVRANTGGGR